MALVVGRGRRAVRLVGGHGFLSDTRGRPLSCLRPLSTARPLGGTAPVAPCGVPVPRRLWTNSQRLRTIKCRAHGGCWSHFFQSSSSVPARYIPAQRSGRRPYARKRRTGKTQIFSLAPGQGNFNFEPD